VDRVYAEWGKMLQQEALDGVIVATPEPEHLAPAEACLRGNLPVLVEKPITTSVEEAERLMAVEKESAAWVFPGHTLRFSPEYFAAFSRVRQGELGNLVWIRAQRLRRPHIRHPRGGRGEIFRWG
jgi:predicted dehydrogenase